MIPSIALSHAHAETSSLNDSLAVLTEFLGFEKLAEKPGSTTLKHPSSAWLLVLNDGGSAAPKKEHHDHYGVRVAANDEIQAAYAHLLAHGEEYRLSEIREPQYSHGSLSVYFDEPGGNTWEIECFETLLRKQSAGGGARLGGVRAPHWKTPLAPQSFPGRGYVAQAFTHGTLACADDKVSGEFYEEVLGLEVHQAYKDVVYVKHRHAAHYVVCLARAVGPNPFSPNFRYTLAVESPAAVEQAHDDLAKRRAELGLMELGPVEAQESMASFLLRDMDGNWWEVSG